MKKIDLQHPDFKKSPFKVPEGYFEQFTAQMMEQLPATPQQQVVPSKGIVKKLRPVFYAAAMVCGIVLGVQFYQHVNQPVLQDATAMANIDNSISLNNSQDVDDFCDYARIEHEDVYACVTGEN